jgi:hypothetical protein
MGESVPRAALAIAQRPYGAINRPRANRHPPRAPRRRAGRGCTRQCSAAHTPAALLPRPFAARPATASSSPLGPPLVTFTPATLACNHPSPSCRRRCPHIRANRATAVGACRRTPAPPPTSSPSHSKRRARAFMPTGVRRPLMVATPQGQRGEGENPRRERRHTMAQIGVCLADCSNRIRTLPPHSRASNNACHPLIDAKVAHTGTPLLALAPGYGGGAPRGAQRHQVASSDCVPADEGARRYTHDEIPEHHVLP